MELSPLIYSIQTGLTYRLAFEHSAMFFQNL